MQGFEFNTVGRIVSGAGSALALAGELRQLGVSRPMLVTDPGLVAIGLVQPVIAALEQEGLSPLLFDQVREDPPEDTVLAAADAARNAGVDGLFAVGGGSSMDVAKVVAVLLGGDQPLAELYGVGMVSGSRLPLVLVPTTAGTGSEVTPVAVITTGETTKAGVSSPVLLPDVAVLEDLRTRVSELDADILEEMEQNVRAEMLRRPMRSGEVPLGGVRLRSCPVRN